MSIKAYVVYGIFVTCVALGVFLYDARLYQVSIGIVGLGVIGILRLRNVLDRNAKWRKK